MRATTVLLTAVLGFGAVIGGYALLRGPDVAHGEDKPVPPPAPVEKAVPGPLRPVDIAPAPVAEQPTDKKRPQAVVAQDEPRPAKPPLPPAAQTPPPPPPQAYEGLFRPGATGEKAGGKAVARLPTLELKLEKLAVTAGRDLELWLVALDRVGNGADLSETKHVSLGKLKKAEGDQTYRLPPELDLRVYRTVVVWSRRERSARATALLQPQAAVRPTPAKPKRAR